MCRLIRYDAVNVTSVWQIENGQDLSKVSIVFADKGFTKDDLGKNENLLEFGSGNQVSHVTGDKNNIGFMNINDSGNAAAHEFGHFLGLSDRYYEGAAWNQSSGEVVNARTFGMNKPISENDINDPEYISGNNLYSTGSSTLTHLQIEIANSPVVEGDYQRNHGYFYNVARDGRILNESRYKVKNGKVKGPLIPLGKGSTRNRVKQQILDKKLY